MYRIIDGKGTGKTSRLMLLAKENNGIIVCKNPEAMRKKAYAYGITGIDFISYIDFDIDICAAYGSGSNYERPVFIDEIDEYFKQLNFNIQGYTLSNED
jgi:hypothetical protein